MSAFCVMVPFMSLTLAQKNVVSLSKSFDIDGDGFSEFLALEKQSADDPSTSSAAFYEIDELGSHTELWRHTSPRHIITAEIGDLNGDGSLEITLLSRSSSLGAGADDPPWLKVFQWTGFDFSPSATITLNGVRDSERLRPAGIALIDFDLDGTDEISFAQSSPRRALSINSLLETGDLKETASLSSNTINAGYGPIHLVEINYDNDSAPDLMALSPEVAQVRLQVFTSRDGRLLPGTSALPSYPPGISPPIGLISSGIVSVDINKDNEDEVLLPFQQGSVLAVQRNGLDYKLVPLEDDQASLFQFSAPLTELDINDILLDRAELGMIGSTLQPMRLNALPVATVKPQPKISSVSSSPASEIVTAIREPEPLSAPSFGTMRLSATPVAANESPQPASPVEPSPAVIGLTGSVQQVGLASINRETGKVSAPSSFGATSASGRMRQISLSTLGNSPGGSTAVSDTAFVGAPFIYPVVPSSGTMTTFRKTMMPDGARFNASSRNIEWTPTPAQVGFHRFEFQIVVQGGGGRPDVQEVRGQGVTVRSASKTEFVQFMVAVLE